VPICTVRRATVPSAGATMDVRLRFNAASCIRAAAANTCG
jgi:hypothetical protein